MRFVTTGSVVVPDGFLTGRSVLTEWVYHFSGMTPNRPISSNGNSGHPSFWTYVREVTLLTFKDRIFAPTDRVGGFLDFY